MKRTELIRSLRMQAADVGAQFGLVRQGREHEVWQFGSITVAIPRHRELSPGVTRRILRDAKREVEGQ